MLRPKYITFDCYGTLTRFQMADVTRDLFQDRVGPDRIEALIDSFAGYRYDEVLGPWQPYEDVVRNALKRTMLRWGLEYQEEQLRVYYDAVPTWGPHADVPEPLARVAEEFPLVIFSNAADEQIQSNVDKLGAPFHRVFTAEQAQVYKPRFRAFEYMLDNLGCNPEDVLHVSSSLRYDLMSAHDLGIKNKVFVNRGHEPSTPYYQYHEIEDIGGLPGIVGL